MGWVIVFTVWGTIILVGYAVVRVGGRKRQK